MTSIHECRETVYLTRGGKVYHWPSHHESDLVSACYSWALVPSAFSRPADVRPNLMCRSTTCGVRWDAWLGLKAAEQTEALVLTEELRRAAEADQAWREVPCVEWSGPLSPEGYGRSHRALYAHRIEWERVHGEIADGLEIDHLCKNRACIEVRHLEAVTGRVNRLRSDGAAGMNARRVGCNKPGHGPYDMVRKNSKTGRVVGRMCRKCRQEARRAHLLRTGK